MTAPKWLSDLLGDHELDNKTFGDCFCGWQGMELHETHVAEVVWAAFTERVNEAWINKTGPFFTAPYLIERLGGFPDELDAHIAEQADA